MAAIYIISILSLAGAATAIQYRYYKKNHLEGREGKCNCKH
jgi:hypothetical protein